jgi:hypothetical protein
MAWHKFLCPSCYKEVGISAEGIGKVSKCSLCGVAFTVPTREQDASLREKLKRKAETEGEEKRRRKEAEQIRKEEERRQEEAERISQREEKLRPEELERTKREFRREAEAAEAERIRPLDAQRQTVSAAAMRRLSIGLGIVGLATGFIFGLGVLPGIAAVILANRQRRLDATDPAKLGRTLGIVAICSGGLFGTMCLGSVFLESYAPSEAISGGFSLTFFAAVVYGGYRLYHWLIPRRRSQAEESNSQRVAAAPPWLLCVFLCAFGAVWTISFFYNSDISPAELAGLAFGFLILTATLIAVGCTWRINRLSVAAAFMGYLAVVEFFRDKAEAGHALTLSCAVLWTGSFLVSKLANASPATHVQCPDCYELIHKEARICGHCGCKLVP